jgi:acetyl esterase/lipase
MSAPGKFVITIILGLLAFAVLLVAGVAVAVNVSPRPFAWFIRRQFSGGIGPNAVTPAVYDELRQKVRAERDVQYPSKLVNNQLDVFSPKDLSNSLATIIWTHGGAFVGGDKDDIVTWSTMMAAKGYTVVSINYALAPAQHYPGPIIQLGEAYEFLKSNRQRFPTINLHRLVIGGDSAGAQIASQFAAVQTNAELARSMEVGAVIPKEELLAVVLYCGPYDLKGLYDLSGSWFFRFFVRQLGWAYFGIRNWRDSPQAEEASTVENVATDYPPTFLTDGNYGSFQRDAKELEAKLRERNVYVDSLYFSPEHGKFGHEYQFDFSTPESMECFERTLAFLAKVTVSK